LPVRHRSVEKRNRQSKVRALRNKARKTRVKNVIKAVRQAVVANQPEQAAAALQVATSTIDQVAARGTLHWKTAARKISRLSRQVNALRSSS